MDFTKDIYINKDKIYENSEIVILYKGFLFSNTLTDDVYITYGYGNMWENKNEIKMKPSTFGYLATLEIGYGKELQFCFKNSAGTWDNNNNQNYILPIEETASVLSFEPILNTSNEITFEILTEETTSTPEYNTNELFETSVISSHPVELYQTVDLENITKQAIPDNTIITQINLNTNNENVVSNTVVKTPEVQNHTETFAEITSKAKENSVTAFDENKVTAGSVYVNSITQPVPKIVENIEEKSLIKKPTNYLTNTFSFVGTLFKNVKLAFTKIVNLVKTSFNFGENKE